MSCFSLHPIAYGTQFAYRLSTCPELSLGLFTRPKQTDEQKQSDPNPPHRLIAHIIATRTTSPVSTDASMEYPPDWRTRKPSDPKPDDDKEVLGHEEFGRTIAVHSCAVSKEHHNKGLGSILMKAYTERMRSAKVADRIALLAHDELLRFYQRFGFVDHGPSASQFGGTSWRDLVRPSDSWVLSCRCAVLTGYQVLDFSEQSEE